MAATGKAATEQRWIVKFHDDFDAEFNGLDEDVQDVLLAAAKSLAKAGPQAERPLVGTLTGSAHKNMKELRFKAKGNTEIWRALFAFDLNQQAYILVAGDKQGKNEDEFYKSLIKIADSRFTKHLEKSRAGKAKTEAKVKAEAKRR